MATRSTIAVQHADGTVSQVYCHWDGYLSHNGKLLFEHYSSLEKAEALVALGDISSLKSTIGEKHPFDNPNKFGSDEYKAHEALYGHMTKYYARDRGDENSAPAKYWNFEMYHLSGDRQEYDYIFRNGAWHVMSYASDNRLIPLSDAFQIEEANEAE